MTNQIKTQTDKGKEFFNKVGDYGYELKRKSTKDMICVHRSNIGNVPILRDFYS